jgi:uncharacterized iron-regulated membrane protein
MARLLILIHRYLGIPLSLVFVVWFISGVVMIYTGGLPSITREERLARIAPIDMTRVRLGAEVAWSQAGMTGSPSGVQLATTLGRPAYRFATYFGAELTVFADTGDVFDNVSSEEAALAAGRYLDVSTDQLRFIETLVNPDQWTLAQAGDLPLHLFSVDDADATRAYVSVASGEVALVTTRTSRFFAWIGVIPHWLYFTPLRINQPVWYWTVVGLSVLGCLLATIGLILAFTQFRVSSPFSLEKSIRYRGWMRWHYFSGAIFGVFALTWVFSGLMSMEPFAWTNATGLEVSPRALSGGDLDVAAFPSIDRTSAAGSMLNDLRAAEVRYMRILGEAYFAVTRSISDQSSSAMQAEVARERLHQPYPLSLDKADTQILIHAGNLASVDRFDTEVLVRAIAAATPDASIETAELLEEHDAYYYSRNGDAPLPVLRLKFDDPMATWYYIDPSQARVVARTHRYSRIERWLFNGLHSLDFAFWYDKRPLWDIGMIALSLGALLTSAIGMFLGLRRLMPFRGRNEADQ